MRIHENIDELRQICQLSYPDWDRQPRVYLHIRKVSIYLTWILLHLPLSANQVSLLMIAAGLFASALFALNYLIVAIITLQLFVLLDFCDGEVARYRKQHSLEGVWLDQISHFWVHPSLFAGITIGAYQTHPSTWIVVAGFIAIISMFVLDMVQWYATPIVLWMSLQEWLKELRAAKEEGGEQAVESRLVEQASVQNVEPMASGLLQWANRVGVHKILDRTARYWHFPYVMFAITLVALIQLFLPMLRIADVRITPLALFVSFSVVTFPVWIVVFLTLKLLRSTVTRNYDHFVSEVRSLLTNEGRVSK